MGREHYIKQYVAGGNFRQFFTKGLVFKRKEGR